MRAKAAGRLLHEARELGHPAVGDWVALRLVPDGRSVIEAVLPRRSLFARQAAGGVAEAQVVAANVDVVFLVAGLDGNFSVRRIERYVTTAWASGAEPVIVLNKAAENAMRGQAQPGGNQVVPAGEGQGFGGGDLGAGALPSFGLPQGPAVASPR